MLIKITHLVTFILKSAVNKFIFTLSYYVPMSFKKALGFFNNRIVIKNYFITFQFNFELIVLKD